MSEQKADIEKQLWNCSFCPKMCRHSCPVAAASGHEGHTPQAMMERLNQLRLGHREWTPKEAEALYACTGCGHCTEFCRHENEPARVLFAGRSEANRRGATHPNLQNYPERFRGRERRLSQELRKLTPRTAFRDSADVAFFPGCDGVDKAGSELEGVLRLLSKLSGQEVPATNVGPACGGYPLLAAGYLDMFRWHASRMGADLKPYRTVVVNCSACVHTMRSLYAAEGVSLATEIVSVPEFLMRYVDELPTPDVRPPIYYHDPCHLARDAGIVDEPRRVLEKFAEVREFSWNRQQTDCCGGGGLLPKTMPHVADAMAKRRLRGLAQRGGGTVVTAGATCAFMLKSNAPNGVTVFDFATYLQSRVEDLLAE